MKPFRALSTSEQLADHLRQQIHEGVIKGPFPGVQHLVKTLGVNSVAVGKAVQQLEREGLLISQGHRKCRLVAEDAQHEVSSLRVGMLLYDPATAFRHDVLSIKQELMNAGHAVISAPKSMLQLGMDAGRTARHIRPIEVDAWVIFAGSRQILEWFERQDAPAFALYGRFNRIPMAGMGVEKRPVMTELIGKLVGMGHRRIVMLAREERRVPQLGKLEQSFLADLEQHGIPTGRYNIPDWQDTPEGLARVIDSLFKVTPPTALMVGDSSLFHAIQLHLANRGVIAPKDISLFCNDYEESFRPVRPEISHFRWDNRPTVRRIVQWANRVSQRRQDTKQSFVKARLCEGGTMGPAKVPD